jgi:hypothetical protein
MQKPPEERYKCKRSEYWKEYYQQHRVDIKLREYYKLLNGNENAERLSNRIS